MERSYIDEVNKTWRGELFLRGKVRRFVADDGIVDHGLGEEASDTPVLVGARTFTGSLWDMRDTLTLTSLSVMSPGVPVGLAQRLYQGGAISEAATTVVEELVGLIASLKTPLRDMLVDVFSNEEIAASFVSCPASHKHHHSKAGGLLSHSVACAHMVKRVASMRMEAREVEITTVAALLHDIGKTRTHQNSGTQSVLGQCVSHECAGIEILAPYLKDLEGQWKVGADLLRHMLGWDRAGQRFPAFPGTLLVTLCDQFDTALDLRAQSFEGKPGWFGYAPSCVTPGQRFLRIPE
jgi:putative nucleotidyltransferase with HDIG domain